MICKNCGREYSDFRSRCPGCGYCPDTGEIENDKNNYTCDSENDDHNKTIITKVKKNFDTEKEEKWFNFYKVAPTVFAIIIAVLAFIVGIVIMAVGPVRGYYHNMYDEINILYGIVVCWLGGGLTAFLTYVFLKLSFCYKILHIEYLKKILAKR